MTEVSKVICDNCAGTLTEFSSYPAKFALKLEVIDVNKNDTGMCYAVAMHPPFKGVKHFCNSKCLSEWLGKKDNEEVSRNATEKLKMEIKQ